MVEKQSNTFVAASQSGISESDSQSNKADSSWAKSALGFWRRQSKRPEPVRVRDLVLLPLGISATAGLIAGGWPAAHRHFLDPAFIGYSIIVEVTVQIVILFCWALALAFHCARRRPWFGVLIAIGFFLLPCDPGLA